MAELRWFADWLVDHLALHKKSQGLPELGSEAGNATFDAWHDAITGRRINRDGATAASKRLIAEPSKFKSDHFPTFLKFAEDATRNLDTASGQRSQHDLSTREGAEYASRGCDRCGGMGLATVEYGEPAYADACGMPRTTAAYCVCAFGRWIQRNHNERAKDVAARMPDLNDAIMRRGPWCLHASSIGDGGEVGTETPREMILQMVDRHRMPAKTQTVA